MFSILDYIIPYKIIIGTLVFKHVFIKWIIFNQASKMRVLHTSMKFNDDDKNNLYRKRGWGSIVKKLENLTLVLLGHIYIMFVESVVVENTCLYLILAPQDLKKGNLSYFYYLLPFFSPKDSLTTLHFYSYYHVTNSFKQTISETNNLKKCSISDRQFVFLFFTSVW